MEIVDRYEQQVSELTSKVVLLEEKLNLITNFTLLKDKVEKSILSRVFSIRLLHNIIFLAEDESSGFELPKDLESAMRIIDDLDYKYKSEDSYAYREFVESVLKKHGELRKVKFNISGSWKTGA